MARLYDGTGLTLEELEAHLDRCRDATREVREDLLEAALLTAQADPPRGCGRKLVSQPALDEDGNDTGEPVTITVPITSRERSLDGALVPYGRARVPDAREVLEVRVDGTVVTGYTPVTRNGLVVRLDELPAGRVCAVTGRFGFGRIPLDLRIAIYVLVAHHLADRESGFADRVVVGEGVAAGAYFRSLPARTKAIFADYAVDLEGVGLA